MAGLFAVLAGLDEDGVVVAREAGGGNAIDRVRHD